MKTGIFIIGILVTVCSVMPSYEKEISRPQGVTLEGVASWYSQKDPGVRKNTANMEKFDDRENTCAMWDIPFNTMLKVTNCANGRSVLVRVNDRGPAKRLARKGRIIDLSRSAFSRIAPLKNGLIQVKVEVIPYL